MVVNELVLLTCSDLLKIVSLIAKWMAFNWRHNTFWNVQLARMTLNQIVVQRRSSIMYVHLNVVSKYSLVVLYVLYPTVLCATV